MAGKSYFDNVAPEWDNLRAHFFPETVRDKALVVARVQSGTIAADIGAGTGFITEGLIAQGVQVIAVDQSRAMLDVMQRKFRKTTLVDCRVGEARDIPIPDNTVDYVFANMYLHHVESPPDAIREMVRILKPGGLLVITDLDEHSFEFLRTEHHDRWLGFKRDDVRDWFSRAGLTQITVDCINETCCTQSDCGEQMADIRIFIALGKK